MVGMDESDAFAATPTAEGCRHRAEVAALLLDAGALGVEPADVAELAKDSHCQELVKVLEQHVRR